MIRIIGAGILGQQECLLEEKFVARVAAILIFLKKILQNIAGEIL